MSIISMASNTCSVIESHSHLKSPRRLTSLSSAVFNNRRRRSGVIHSTASKITGLGDLSSLSLSSPSVNTKTSISISIIYLPSGTRGVVAQSPEPEAHDKSD